MLMNDEKDCYVSGLIARFVREIETELFVMKINIFYLVVVYLFFCTDQRLLARSTNAVKSSSSECGGVIWCGARWTWGNVIYCYRVYD